MSALDPALHPAPLSLALSACRFPLVVSHSALSPFLYSPAVPVESLYAITPSSSLRVKFLLLYSYHQRQRHHHCCDHARIASLINFRLTRVKVNSYNYPYYNTIRVTFTPTLTLITKTIIIIIIL